jgi:peptide-methionine (S)-S-oxide reductase
MLKTRFMYTKDIIKLMDKDQSERDSRLMEVATLGGGCFWCTEAVFSEVKGVVRVLPGYSGGHVANPTYEQVCTGTTGHAEVVQITFNPDIISFRELLEIFFAVHDPTTLNHQGGDVGTQYRSVIFYHSREQKATAEKLIEELNKAEIYDAPIVTKVELFKAFYEAEEYHRDYFRRHSEQPYCKLVISPKIAKLRRNYRSKFKLVERESPGRNIAGSVATV